jgi:hypothetical protein
MELFRKMTGSGKTLWIADRCNRPEWDVMTSASKPSDRMHLLLARLAVAAFGALITADDGQARTARSERAIEAVSSRTGGEPILAIVSLRNQRVTVYDADGWILRAPVSSGQKGRETPAGVFTVLQKKAEHYSNLYDDAYMPHMQRITWSGIALHGGVLPGYPASHGCVRLPFDFAARLFDVTRLGMRVIVAPGDVVPVEVSHPALFQTRPGAGVLAAARAAEADAAARRADQARLTAVTASREAARATVAVRVAENLRRRAEAQLAATEVSLDSALPAEANQQAANAKAKVIARIAELEEQWAAAQAELQPKLAAVASAREVAVAAEAARVAAAEAAREVARDREPVSVFISRKTQRLYVRRALQAILESPVTLLDPDRPIGTHVFTAVERSSGDTELRWSVVSLAGRRDGVDATSTDPGAAKAALDRIGIPQEILDRIADMAVTRSSLIISDEALSSETGNETDFVVVLSDEPQGSIKIRRRGPGIDARYGRWHDSLPYWRSPFAGR